MVSLSFCRSNGTSAVSDAAGSWKELDNVKQNHIAHVVHIGKMCVQVRCCFKLPLTYVARGSLHVNVVLLDKMLCQIATMFAFVIALVARKPLNVDVVLVGNMSF